MIGHAALLAWALARPVIHDGHGAELPRPPGFMDVVVTAALERAEAVDPHILVAALDVVAAHESAYRMTAIGDSGRSCGAWQTPCVETPVGHDVGLQQARVALKWMLASMTRCPDHPLALYATGRICGAVHVADFYWTEIRRELAAPEAM